MYRHFKVINWMIHAVGWIVTVPVLLIGINFVVSYLNVTLPSWWIAVLIGLSALVLIYLVLLDVLNPPGEDDDGDEDYFWP